jgi:hypothetical protein
MREIAVNGDPGGRLGFALTRFARMISWVGHPLVFVTATVGVIVSRRLANRAGFSVLLALLVAVVLPTILLLFRGVRSGRWSDADVSVWTERARFYPPAIVISSFGLSTLFFLHAPPFISRGAFITLGLIVVAALLNFCIKLSLHALFAFYCAFILLRIHWAAGALAFVLAFLVFWSRLYLRRHGAAEMLVGAALGLMGGLAVALWS